MIEISFSHLSQILFDLDFCSDAFEAFGNPLMSARLKKDYEYLFEISEVAKNELNRIEK